MEDSVIQGVTSFPIIRSYSSSGAFEEKKDKFAVFLRKLYGNSLRQSGWNLFPDLDLIMKVTSDKKAEISVAEG